MKKADKGPRHIARELPKAEKEQLLSEIGKLIRYMRNERSTLESFVYEIKISRSQMSKYESGSDMLLSTFLKLLYGLDATGEEFFKELYKRKQPSLS